MEPLQELFDLYEAMVGQPQTTSSKIQVNLLLVQPNFAKEDPIVQDRLRR